MTLSNEDSQSNHPRIIAHSLMIDKNNEEQCMFDLSEIIDVRVEKMNKRQKITYIADQTSILEDFRFQSSLFCKRIKYMQRS